MLNFWQFLNLLKLSQGEHEAERAMLRQLDRGEFLYTKESTAADEFLVASEDADIFVSFSDYDKFAHRYETMRFSSETASAADTIPSSKMNSTYTIPSNEMNSTLNGNAPNSTPNGNSLNIIAEEERSVKVNLGSFFNHYTAKSSREWLEYSIFYAKEKRNLPIKPDVFWGIVEFSLWAQVSGACKDECECKDEYECECKDECECEYVCECSEMFVSNLLRCGIIPAGARKRILKFDEMNNPLIHSVRIAPIVRKMIFRFLFAKNIPFALVNNDLVISEPRTVGNCADYGRHPIVEYDKNAEYNPTFRSVILRNSLLERKGNPVDEMPLDRNDIDALLSLVGLLKFGNHVISAEYEKWYTNDGKWRTSDNNANDASNGNDDASNDNDDASNDNDDEWARADKEPNNGFEAVLSLMNKNSNIYGLTGLTDNMSMHLDGTLSKAKEVLRMVEVVLYGDDLRRTDKLIAFIGSLNLHEISITVKTPAHSRINDLLEALSESVVIKNLQIENIADYLGRDAIRAPQLMKDDRIIRLEAIEFKCPLNQFILTHYRSLKRKLKLLFISDMGGFSIREINYEYLADIHIETLLIKLDSISILSEICGVLDRHLVHWTGVKYLFLTNLAKIQKARIAKLSKRMMENQGVLEPKKNVNCTTLMLQIPDGQDRLGKHMVFKEFYPNKKTVHTFSKAGYEEEHRKRRSLFSLPCTLI